jgi:response regulator of citrate/malate metabolism
MNRKPKVVALCDEPRVMRAIVTQTRTWADLYEAADLERVRRLIENHEDAAILVTQLLLRRDDGMETLLTLRDRHRHNRRCLLASYSDLSLVIDVIHHGLIDALVHVPLMKGQFLSAVTGPSLSTMFVSEPIDTALAA